MKLFIYNKENSVSSVSRSGERTIRVNRSNGVVYISKALSEALGLKENEKLLFANDEENPKDWYLCKTNDINGFSLKIDKSGVRFMNKYLSTKILDSAKVEDSATFFVSKEPLSNNEVLFYKIITKPILTAPKRIAPNKEKIK